MCRKVVFTAAVGIVVVFITGSVATEHTPPPPASLAHTHTQRHTHPPPVPFATTVTLELFVLFHFITFSDSRAFLGLISFAETRLYFAASWTLCALMKEKVRTQRFVQQRRY